MQKQNDFGGLTSVRIYDTKLIERLNRHYADSGTRYGSKNNFLTELIEAGLNRREYENGLMDKLAATDAGVNKRLDWLSFRLEGLEKYALERFDEIAISAILNQKLLTALYYLAEAEITGEAVTEQDLESGIGDYLPTRLSLLKRDLENGNASYE